MRVRHACDGYLYLIRQVAAHDARLAAGASLAAYCTASGWVAGSQITGLPTSPGQVKARAVVGRPLTNEGKLASRQEAAGVVFERRTGRTAVDPVELGNLGEIETSASRREAVAGYDLTLRRVGLTRRASAG